MEKTNARRFIDAYNSIDYALRVQHDYKRSMGYSDMIRRAVVVDHVVRKYEDELIDFGRLRNAIIHGSNDEYIIAEPHDDVVLKIEKIAKIITTPPKVLEIYYEKDVFMVNYDVLMKDVIMQMSKTKFSNIPVYKFGKLIGVANGQKILDAFGKFLLKGSGDEFLNKMTIEEIVTLPVESKYYEVVSSEVTIEKVLNIFYTNRKLLAIIITKSGTMNEPPLGIITSSDYMELNNILDNY